jgi:hypothetical protein
MEDRLDASHEARPTLRVVAIGALLFAAVVCPAAAQTTVFSTNFDGASIPSEISPGTAVLTGVQGYAGLGPTGNQFGGNFLRSPTANVVTLQLNGLPAHTSMNVLFLFAAIDSLDGTGTFPAGDFFDVSIDGVTFFSESFANATPSQIQSYVPPAGVELARHVDLGFSGPGSFFTDSAYNLAADPRFSNIPHTASSATITFVIRGEGVQSLDDESWAMDNLVVQVAGGVPAPTSTPTTPPATTTPTPPTGPGPAAVVPTLSGPLLGLLALALAGAAMFFLKRS